MSLRFILGRAGMGKTHYIFDSVTKNVTVDPDGPPVIILVPEQATFQMEYALAKALGGSVRAEVLSFHRLAHRVFLETGGAARIPIGELGKRMVLRQLLEKYRANLRVFGKTAGRPGFADCLARTIGEFKTYLITPGNLDNAGRVIEGAELLKNKLGDLALLYHELNEYMSSRYTDPDDYLTLLAEKLPLSEIFRGAEVWIDGFKGFTPQEIRVIEILLQVTERVNVAFCLDPELGEQEVEDDHVFFPVWDTYRKIYKTALTNGTVIEPPVSLTGEIPARFTKAPDIAHLEKNFFRYPAPVFELNTSNVKITAGSNRRAEVEACARQVIRFSRDMGYRWREIAVFLRDMESYHELISTVFSDYGIPFFIDRKRNVMHHPLVELIRSALEAVIKDWTYQPVFRYLKTDLIPIDREQVYLLENYCLAHGIRGAKWTGGQDWTYLRRYTLGEDINVSELELQKLAEINQARTAASQALVNFTGKISEAGTVKEKTSALYELMNELEIARTIEGWTAEAEAAGLLEKAREHSQIWSKVIDLLDEVVEALGDEDINLETYMEILNAGFESMTLGLIPPGLDQVVVASLDRSRNPEVKAGFILGVSEGVFPARQPGDGIFSDTEREKLEYLGLGLAPGGRRRAFEEQYLVYTALTRAGEKLWVSFPMADDEGRANSPSPVINRLRELLPGIEESSFQSEPVTGDINEFTEFTIHPGRALIYLLGRLRDVKSGASVNPSWWNLYNWFIAHNYTENTESLFDSVFYANKEQPIGKPKSLALYGSPVRASVSRLEKFKACPFAHFSYYGLKLSERKAYRLEAPDMGEFFHAALKMFTEKVQNNSLDWGGLSREECLSMSEEIVDQLAPQLQSEILLSTARYRYLTGKLKKTVNRAVLTLAEHSRRGEFRPKFVEMAFGPGCQVPPVGITLPDGSLMQLSGRIDRVDEAEKDGGVYLRVIDYKSSDQNIRLPEIYHGLKLQLLTYLDVALRYYSENLGKNVKPAGILYYTVREPLIPVTGPRSFEDAAKLVLGKLKMKGFILNHPEVFRMMDNQTESGWSELFPVAIKRDGSFYSSSQVFDENQFGSLREYLNTVFMEVGEEILSGNVDIQPYRDKAVSACTFCGLKPVCKFDMLLKDNDFRTFPRLSGDDIWNLIKGKGGVTDV